LKGADGKPIELGRGPRGVTYKTFDIDLHCFAALKAISETLLREESSRLRFLREARAAASIRHPNVASVFLRALGVKGDDAELRTASDVAGHCLALTLLGSYLTER
jgi:serine/threonine protein kinase